MTRWRRDGGTRPGPSAGPAAGRRLPRAALRPGTAVPPADLEVDRQRRHRRRRGARLDAEALACLPRAVVRADLHCVTRWTVLDNVWEGAPTRALLDLGRRRPTSHVMAWAEYGDSATMRLEDFASPRALLATHHGGEPLTPEHGYPLRLVVPHLYAWKGPSGCAASSTSPNSCAGSGRSAGTTRSAIRGARALLLPRVARRSAG